MPTLSNQRHELFAQNVAAGMSASAALAEAGYADNGSNAWRMKQYDEVKLRVSELQEEKARILGLTRADILEMMADDRELARREGQSAAAIRASELLGGELHGMFAKRTEAKITNPTNELSLDDLKRQAVAIAAELGMVAPKEAPTD